MDAARNCGGAKHDTRVRQSGLEDVRCAKLPLKPEKAVYQQQETKLE
jgi:hypothetical protein